MILPDIFSYLRQRDIPEMIDTEFQIYRYHHRVEDTRMDWIYNIFYSLIQ